MNINPKQYEDNVVYVRWVFLRGLGLVSLLSFLSYLLQFEGLVGDNGLTPWVDFVERVHGMYGWEAYLRFPSMAWWFPADVSLTIMASVGMLSSLLLVFNIRARLNLAVIWALFLSLTITGQQFMAYQWNQLLLEILFGAILLATSTLNPSRVTLPSWVSVWYMRFITFKLYILSGLAKWGGGGSWRDLTAMTYHYETQPIPNPLSWYAHHLPDVFHRLESLFTLVVEAVVPIFIFTPRTIRIPVAYLMGSLQVMIMITGNYGPFNWLALLLCFILLDDEHLSRLIEYVPDGWRPRRMTKPSRWSWEVDLVVVMVLLVFNIFIVGSWLRVPTPDWFNSAGQSIQAFRTVNPYGLFGVMTKKRPEIVIQGSRDGENWKTYQFHYKPGDLDRRPGVAVWSLPRLDWRMWFAALKAPQRPRWMERLVVKLLKGEPSVLDHFAKNPFSDTPPRYIRAWVYDYRFTGWSEGWDTGRWWSRANRREYIPPVTLKGNQLMRATDR